MVDGISGGGDSSSLFHHWLVVEVDRWSAQHSVDVDAGLVGAAERDARAEGEGGRFRGLSRRSRRVRRARRWGLVPIPILAIERPCSPPASGVESRARL